MSRRLEQRKREMGEWAGRPCPEEPLIVLAPSCGGK